MNWEATAHSTGLDKKLWLETGWNEFKSSGFSDGFLKRAETRACSCDN